ncbi:MAG TPA: hypothetical protein VHG72_03660, partial [Polyangia bacterium]|nr:hypothetical protein [Polyangia bacterium]
PGTTGGMTGTPPGDGETDAGGSPGTGGGAPAGPPTLTVGAWPAQPAGTIAVPIVVADFRGLPVTVTVELADAQGSFQAAHLTSPAGPFTASPAGTGAALGWDSIADIGFRDPQMVALRLTPADAQGPGAPVVVTTPVIDNLRAAARRVNHYMITYGALDADDIATAKTYQLVIVDPTQGSLTRDQVASIQEGMDPNDPGDDVIVLGYVSVGEDLRTANLTAAQMRADPRFVGDGQGPRIDPRGWQAAGSRLDGIAPLGAPSNGGLGFASYYLDDNSVDDSATHTGDGIPDRNAIFGGCFVNAGAPAWFDTLDAMTKDGPDQHAGLREVMTTTYGRGLGCDGVFMDTIDTAAPNSFTNASSTNQSSFEWTAPGFSAFIARVHQAYPERLLLQNRGVFFFDPRKPAYEFTTRGSIDFSLYESFMLDSSPLHLSDPYSYPDNRYNYAPKIMVEANRADGFVPLSLDYAEGPPDQMSELTLIGQSTAGYSTLLQDIDVTQNLTGFRDYITNAAVTLVNDFVMTHADFTDTTPPAWTSTWNDTNTSPPSPPTPRVGIQQAVAGAAAGSVVLRWDVALDLNRVGYALYYQTAAFDFTGDPQLTHATRVVLSPGVGDGYVMGVGPHTYPYQQTITGLTSGATYYLLIRAFDSSPAANEDANTRYLAIVAP